jgi:hypothetical protein
MSFSEAVFDDGTTDRGGLEYTHLHTYTHTYTHNLYIHTYTHTYIHACT